VVKIFPMDVAALILMSSAERFPDLVSVLMCDDQLGDAEACGVSNQSTGIAEPKFVFRTK